MHRHAVIDHHASQRGKITAVTSGAEKQLPINPYGQTKLFQPLGSNGSKPVLAVAHKNQVSVLDAQSLRERVRLRGPTAEDADDLFALFSDPEVMRFLGPPRSRADVMALMPGPQRSA